MVPTPEQTSAFLAWVGRASAQAGVLACLVFAIQWALGERLGPRWRCWLWLLVAARLALPSAPESPWSLFNLAPARWPGAGVARIAQQDIPSETAATRFPDAVSASISPTEEPAPTAEPVPGPVLPYALRTAAGPPSGFIHGVHWLALAWGFGALSLLACAAAQSFALGAAVVRRRPATDSATLDLLEDCKTEMGIRTYLAVVETPRAKSPALLGALRPRLLLPEGMAKRLGPERLRHVFIHELAHLKRQDIAVNWLLTLLQAAHWFNPLVWLAFHRLRVDRELACDALALSRLGPGEASEYGGTIVHLAETMSGPWRQPALAGVLEDASQIKRRILMIARFRTTPLRWSILAAAVTIGLAIVALTDARSQQTPREWSRAFVNDPALAGTWETVDFVREISYFQPGQKAWTGTDSFAFDQLIVYPDGTTSGLWRWTKDYLWDPGERNEARYEIKPMDGASYLFLPWINGDVTIRGQKPFYYVLKKTGAQPPANDGPEAAGGHSSPTRAENDLKREDALVRNLPLGIQRRPAPANWGRGALASLPSYDPARTREKPFQVDLRGCDASALDLSNRLADLLHADFDGQTVWPAALPAGFDPKAIAELGRNPGLGVRALHAKGITGKGVGVAILDQALLVDHQEYKDRLRHYEEIHWPADTEAQMHAPAVASLACGQTVGVAPEADLYFIAEQNGEWSGRDLDWDFTWVAHSIERVLQINQTLRAENRIRVISISVGWSRGQKGYEETMAAVKKAENEGVFVVSTVLDGTHGVSLMGLGRDPRKDPDDVHSYSPGAFWRNEFVSNPMFWSGGNVLQVPMDSRTTASPCGAEDYVFYSDGGLSWAVPYLAGLYALACQVRPAIAPGNFLQAALSTGDTVDCEIDGKQYKLGRIVNPARLIEEIEQSANVAERPAHERRP